MLKYEVTMLNKVSHSIMADSIVFKEGVIMLKQYPENGNETVVAAFPIAHVSSVILEANEL